jgi:hypothetical protein
MMHGARLPHTVQKSQQSWSSRAITVAGGTHDSSNG